MQHHLTLITRRVLRIAIIIVIACAIGVTDRSVLFLVLAESVAIALFGGMLGLLLAWGAIPVISGALTGMLPPLLLSKTMLALGLIFAFLVGAASGLLPGIGAMRMRVVNALRRV